MGLHPLTAELALSALKAISKLIGETREGKGFWGMITCGGIGRGALSVEIEESGPATMERI